MDYEAVLAQVLVLLQREGRLSYRVLKRRFGVDDDLLEDLKLDVQVFGRLTEPAGHESVLYRLA
jgi:hypothetical protein